MRVFVYLVSLLLLAANSYGASTASEEKIEKFSGEGKTAVEQRNSLVGRWLGKVQADGEKRMWISDRKSDGTYRIDFRIINSTGWETSFAELGIWGISGGIYFTASRSLIDINGKSEADTTNPALYDTYRLISISDKIFEYQSISTGDNFKATRLATDEYFPAWK